MLSQHPLAVSAVIFAHRHRGRRRMILKVGAATLLAEVAVSPAARAIGLSGRESLGDGEGMLFVIPTIDRHTFWMRNTTIPLSIAFLDDDGKIVSIKDLEPLSEAHVGPDVPARMALEVPRGWFDRRGVHVGDSVAIAS